mmetsp:Transcript_15754/g.31947  ORF Transcript_15754/g.31947 Transcript_15754/m.31947 type:complete len:128 (-) Transcript_15754:2583-2966(-)
MHPSSHIDVKREMVRQKTNFQATHEIVHSGSQSFSNPASQPATQIHVSQHASELNFFHTPHLPTHTDRQTNTHWHFHQALAWVVQKKTPSLLSVLSLYPPSVLCFGWLVCQFVRSLFEFLLIQSVQK